MARMAKMAKRKPVSSRIAKKMNQKDLKRLKKT
jgi:hypothetical protein